MQVKACRLMLEVNAGRSVAYVSSVKSSSQQVIESLSLL